MGYGVRMEDGARQIGWPRVCVSAELPTRSHAADADTPRWFPLAGSARALCPNPCAGPPRRPAGLPPAARPSRSQGHGHPRPEGHGRGLGLEGRLSERARKLHREEGRGDVPTPGLPPLRAGPEHEAQTGARSTQGVLQAHQRRDAGFARCPERSGRPQGRQAENHSVPVGRRRDVSSWLSWQRFLPR